MVKKSHVKLVGVLACIVIGMFAFGFALVPLYNSLCKTLGINGKTNAESIAYDANKVTIQKNREIKVEFIAIKNGGVPWEF